MKAETVILRISESEKERWKTAAEKRQMTLSEYIRYVVTKETDQNRP